ncbi:MAG: amidohydrolase family protein [Xanthomonadales bacterium]|nr:amidohydrolase family protein [Xanthomonadales bacterium]
MSAPSLVRAAFATLAIVLLPGQMSAQAPDQRGLLFENVRVFDGTSDRLTPPSNVLVVGNRIQAVSRAPITPDAGLEVRRIDGGGRTLMPGLIDAHWHALLVAPDLMTAMTADAGLLNFLAADVARQTLMQGFTSVRDVGGPSFGLKRAIDLGLVPGPRIFPSGAMISQTGGHGDFRLPHEVPRPTADGLNHAERMGAAMIADGADAVRVRAREQLMLGASQLKLMAGGGVSSLYDPLDATQYTVAEIRAAVEAAENWGTYVTVHAYTAHAIRQAIEAGVRCIEHGQLIDEDTARLMAERGVWWSLQPFLDDEDSNPKQGEARRKQLMVAQGTDRAFTLARRLGIKVAFGTDILFNPAGVPRHNAQLVKLSRWYSPAQVLAIATGGNGELLALSGERSTYRGALGVVAPGALADLILVDGDPIEDLALVADPVRNFLVIVKDGVVVKDALAGGAPPAAPSP